MATLFRTLQEEEHGEAVVQIANQLMNDLVDLLGQLRDGQGRPAARTARAQIENLINLRSVLNDPLLAQRFVDHEGVVQHALDDYERSQSPPQRSNRTARHQRQKLLTRYEGLLAKYGKGFRTQWSGDSTSKRLKRLGLGRYLPYYELSSMVVHGTVGGVRGSRRPIAGAPVYRLGPALALCPGAYREGLSASRDACLSFRGLLDEHVVEVPLQLLDLMLEAQEEYRDAVIAV